MYIYNFLPISSFFYKYHIVIQWSGKTVNKDSSRQYLPLKMLPGTFRSGWSPCPGSACCAPSVTSATTRQNKWSPTKQYAIYWSLGHSNAVWSRAIQYFLCAVFLVSIGFVATYFVREGRFCLLLFSLVSFLLWLVLYGNFSATFNITFN